MVYFDGVTKALEQDFSYATTWSTGGANPYGLPNGAQFWTSKTTTVTTKDWLRSGTPSYKTIYTYIPSISWPQDPTSTSAPSELPLESKIVYQDTTGSVLRTVTKTWNSSNQLAGECTTLPNNQTSGVFYQYEPYGWSATQAGQLGPGVGNFSTDQVADLQEFDYGSVATPCQNPGTTPARETETTFASLGNTPYWPSGQYMSDRPSQVQVFDHGTRISQTNYSYDQTAVAAASQQPIYGRDTVYGATSPSQPRGNTTTISKCLISNGSCQSSISTILTYDETGQVISVQDARGYTTTLSYKDSFTDGAPPSGYYTDTYLTSITPPTTNGTSHQSTYVYDYEKGELSSATDENLQQSTFSYYGNSFWNRPMQATFPDGGQKSYTYSDSGPNPSVSISTLMNSGGTSETSTTIMDGVGHVLYTELTSDPFGSDTVQTTYDGNGRVWTKSNPFRGCPAPANPYSGCNPPANTTTTYNYDALGRSVQTSQQDGSTLQSCYDDVVSSPAVYCSAHLGSVPTGTWVDSTDENGNHWQRTSDSFGRLTEVMEPNGSSQTASMETDYAYNMLNDLLSVTQWGGQKNSAGARGRSFSYDSLSRLQTAANPETGTICYGQWSGSNCAGGYDANGNLLYKTDGRGLTTSFTYDPLNRVVSKTYPNDTTGTSISCFQYDTSTFVPTGGYQIGRLTNAWTQATKTACTGSSPYFAPVTGSFLTLKSMAYDKMGRLAAAQQQQCIGSQCSAPTTYSLNMLYDLAGNMNQLTNSVGAAGQPLTLLNYFDAAAHPCLTTSSWNDNSPLNLFQDNPSLTTPGYAAFGGLLNWSMGSSSSSASRWCGSSPTSPINVTQGYTNRLWVNGISATGQIP